MIFKMNECDIHFQNKEIQMSTKTNDQKKHLKSRILSILLSFKSLFFKTLKMKYSL